jgi:leucyl-tRNA synthetase
MNGKKVFFPVGWDAFGLPAENYAIKTGVPPAITTKNAIDTFRRQIKRLGISYDWANETATNHPEYYKWTQWIFLQLYKKGLAYKGIGMVNWCPNDQTVLANEQVVDGKCERCGAQVIQKELEQWYFKITDYKEELLSGLEKVDWPEPTKQQQRNWIGKSSGANVRFEIVSKGAQVDTLEVFTTAHDTIYGCTFMVVAPENPLVAKLLTQVSNADQVKTYVKKAAEKTELDRQIQKEKTGVRLEGVEAKNPLTGKLTPIYVADYVLAGYGTGAIMAVPGHDERDYDFAQKHHLPVVYVTSNQEFVSYSEIKAQPEKFILKNSAEFDGQNFIQARAGILAKLVKQKAGQEKHNYKLRDWLISRQRYWGAPIPIVYDPEGKAHPVKEEHLPWLLPTDVDFKPNGESPLKSSKEFFERTERLYGKGWKPECDTMDTFVDSSWYFLRYVDSRNKDVFAHKEALQNWLPVDLYLIGPEHIVLHLLYSRFFTKFLRDEGYLHFDEPFMKMRHQGMILGPDGKKMSKSKGNVINPDEVIEKFGADTLRIYEMFMGPLEADKPWDTNGVVGIYRFLQKVWNLSQQVGSSSQTTPVLAKRLAQTMQKVGRDLPALKFNTAIASLMIFVNDWAEEAKKLNDGGLSPLDLKRLSQILAPLAPFMAEELWAALGEKKSIHLSTWPAFDPELAKEDSIKIAIQINGKVRDQITVPAAAAQDQAKVEAQAKLSPVVQKWLDGKEIRKVIFVPAKIISFVI